MMEEIPFTDVQAAYDEMLSALDETLDGGLDVLIFGVDGPPYDEWWTLIETYAAGRPEAAETVAEDIDSHVIGPLRSNAGEARYGESGGQTSQGLSDPVQNMYNTVVDWTDQAGQEFKSVYLMSQSGLQNNLQYQYEFAIALQAVMQTQQSVLLFARAGVIDILLDTADVLRAANAHREKKRSTIGDMLANTLIETGAAALTGGWVGAAAAALKGVAQIAYTEMTWPDTDNCVEICAAMVDNFDTLRGDLDEQANGVGEALVELRHALSGSDRESLMPALTT